MSPLSPSLFIKEPGRTKSLLIESPELKSAAKALGVGSVLEVRTSDGKVSLYRNDGTLVAEVNEQTTTKKIVFTLTNGGEVMVIFVGFTKNSRKPSAQFLVKSSLPVFAEETSAKELKPFARSGEIPPESDDEEDHHTESDENEDITTPHEKDPLSGLRIVDKNSKKHLDDEESVDVV